MLHSEVRSPTLSVARGLPQQIASRARVRWEPIALVATLLLAAAARFYAIGREDLWLDEAFSVFIAQQPLARMLDLIIQHDTHPPLYHTLLHFWVTLGPGSGAASVRLLSALLGVAAIPFVYLLGRAIGGARVGFIAALLMAISPFAVWYGQEARMYALLSFLCAASAYFLLDALKRGSRRAWMLYVIVTTLALYSQLSAALFFVSASAAAVLYVGFGSGDASRRFDVRAFLHTLRPWIISQVAIVLLWLPWLPNAAYQSQTYQAFWIEVPTLATLQTFVFEMTSSYLAHWRVPFGQQMLVGAALLLVVLAAARLGRRESAYLLALLVVPVAIMYLASQIKPLFLSRALIYVLPPFLILVAAGLMALPRWRVGSILLGLLLLLNIVSDYRIYSVVQKEEWGPAASFVTTRATPGELVLFVAADSQLSFDYYAARSQLGLQEHGLPLDVFQTRPLEPPMQEQDQSRIDQLAEGRTSFWLVESHTFFADPRTIAREYASAAYRLRESHEFQGVTVSHYDVSLTTQTDQQERPEIIVAGERH